MQFLRSMQQVGLVLGKCREAKGFTIEEAGFSTGMSPTIIRKMEFGMNGTYQLEQLKEYADFLGCLGDVFTCILDQIDKELKLVFSQKGVKHEKAVESTKESQQSNERMEVRETKK